MSMVFVTKVFCWLPSALLLLLINAYQPPAESLEGIEGDCIIPEEPFSDRKPRYLVRLLESGLKPANSLAFSPPINGGVYLFGGGRQDVAYGIRNARIRIFRELGGLDELDTDAVDDGIYVWDLQEIQAAFRDERPLQLLWSFLPIPSSGEVTSIAVSPSGGHLAVGNFNGDVMLFPFDKPADESSLQFVSTNRLFIKAASFSPNGEIFAFSSSISRESASNMSHEITLVNIQSGKSIDIRTRGAVQSLSFSPDSRLLVSSSRDAMSGDGVVNLWDSQSGKLVRTIGEYQGRQIFAVAFINDQSVAFSPTLMSEYVPSDVDPCGCGLESLCFWNLEGRKQRELPLGDRVRSISISPNGRYIAVGGYSGKISLLDMTDRARVIFAAESNSSSLGHLREVNSVDFSPNWSEDGIFASSSLDGRIAVWQLPLNEN